MKGKIRVGSNHRRYGYEVIFHCEPKTDNECAACKYRFKCYTNEEIVVAFIGNTIGMFPGHWKCAEPSAQELERHLFGKVVSRLHLRVIPSCYDIQINKGWDEDKKE